MRPSSTARLLALGGALLVAGCSALQLDEALVPPATGFAPAPPLEQVWRREVPGGFGPSAPLPVGSLLLLGTASGDLVALDRRTGARAGSHAFGESVEGAIVVAPDGQTVVVPVARGRATVRAYDARSGRERWRWTGTPVTGGVVLVGSTVVASTRNGRTVGLDLATGAERWAHEAPAGTQIQAAPVALGDGCVVVATDRGTVVALDAQTGGEVWTADAGAPVYHTPSVFDGRLAVATTRGRLVVLDAATGEVAWALDVGTGVRLSPPAIGPDGVLVGGSDGSVRSVDASSGAERWTHEGTGAVAVRPLVSDGRVYVGTLDRTFVVLDATTGASQWSTELRGRVRGAPVAADGAVYLLTEPRHVVAFRTARSQPPSP